MKPVKSSNAYRPLGSSLVDSLYLLSPRTWIGAMLMLDRNPVSPFSLLELAQSILAIILPTLAVTILCSSLVLDLGVAGDGLVLSSMISPLTLTGVASLMSQVIHFAAFVNNWRAKRHPVLSEALLQLKIGMEKNRIHRYRRYDVYLPPRRISPNTPVLCFLPGALVSHSAYSEVLSKLSDEGVMVVSLSMEPFRLSVPHMGADSGRIRRVLREVASKYRLDHARTVDEWCFGGHSQGAFAAIQLTQKLRPSKTVLWAVSPNFFDPAYDISGQVDTDIMLIQGSKDELCKPWSPEFEVVFEKLFPPTAKKHYIEGGTHNQFASYPWNARIDGVPTISRNEQHLQVTSMTAKFLKKNNGHSSSSPVPQQQQQVATPPPPPPPSKKKEAKKEATKQEGKQEVKPVKERAALKEVEEEESILPLQTSVRSPPPNAAAAARVKPKKVKAKARSEGSRGTKRTATTPSGEKETILVHW